MKASGADPELVSIIVPVHDALPRLEGCLASIRAQTHPALQVVLVDDGSTDGSGALCDEEASRDQRLEVVHQRNAGPSAARNRGLERARGTWVLFVDADDSLETDYVARMLAVAREDASDVLIGDCIIEEGGAERRFGMVIPDRCYEDRTELFQDFLSDCVPWSLWGKLYRAEALAGLRFDERDYLAEDLDFNARLFAREGLVVSTTALAGYRYHVGEGSLDHSFGARHLRQFDVFERVVSLVEHEGIGAEASPAAFYERRVLNCLHKAVTADALTPQVKRTFSEAVARHRAEALSAADAEPWLKRQLRASRLGIGVLARIFRMRG